MVDQIWVSYGLLKFKYIGVLYLLYFSCLLNFESIKYCTAGVHQLYTLLYSDVIHY